MQIGRPRLDETLPARPPVKGNADGLKEAHGLAPLRRLLRVAAVVSLIILVLCLALGFALSPP